MTPDPTASELPASPASHIRLFLEGVQEYAIFMLDASGTVLSWNHGAERLFGYRAEEAIGGSYARFFVPEDVRAGRPADDLRRADAHGQLAAEGWHARKDGTRFWATELTTSLRDERGRLHGYARVMRDATERKHLETELRRQADELAQANRRKDEFLAMLSHELRNPLAPVLNAVQILRHAPHDAAVVQRAGGMIERQVKHMARLIDDLLEVTRFTRGKVTLRPERLDLRAVVGAAADAVRARMRDRGLAFETTAADAAIWVEADPARLDQVLAHLLDNAAKYSDPGGRVEMSTARDGGAAVVRVRDTGTGIPPDVLPRVFDLFAQADTSLDRERGGLGIGLTLVKGLVTLHGGTIEALSDGPGRGAEFVVRLPLLAAGDAGPGPPPAIGLRILVVDDNVDTATSLGMLLEMHGHEVETAHDGARAVESARERPFDALLLDIGLPGIDGYETARRVRALAGVPRPLIIAVSGYGFDHDRVRGQEAGFDHHLVKPVDVSRITALLSASRR
ncbi:chemotaxis protein : Two-component hybrid sensor and regulator OS=Sorangium cellulosum (strain So ce56) GN=sce0929 PE=4 SV=1: PAS_9: HisKA: HATPase_c: Response_reg [Gemmata massiliana]|uniref:histidine kinase n=1 Tax=Gemmata massiliana TaxID=1210884 RepID=A0A6P2D028_9BACT|nr:ATP-binding protein [Gemmata massiliana]VTR92782.1 chemotaxis protein : Two-component hybrid sensor and regulator OS=Sorangium cellulosum (strain So ce56) GN=sce0929 PE=4 SV=1: PAS_9: HisKA: HATPase_c: Response_reg [Gemmata massiliana]